MLKNLLVRQSDKANELMLYKICQLWKFDEHIKYSFTEVILEILLMYTSYLYLFLFYV